MNDAFDDPTLQALLDAERHADEGPPDAVRDRLFGRVMASVAAPVPPVDPTTAAGPAASGAELAAASSTAGSAAVGAAAAGAAVGGAKLWLVVGVVAASLGAGALALRGQGDAPRSVEAPAVVAQAESAEVEAAPPAPVTPPSAAATEADAVARMPLRRGPATVAAAPKPKPKPARRARPRAAPKARPRAPLLASRPPSSAPAQPRKDLALAAERVLLIQGASALRGGDAAGALAAVEGHRARFPKARLVEEREVLHVRALMLAGRRADAKATARAFLDRFPRSVFRGSIEAALTR